MQIAFYRFAFGWKSQALSLRISKTALGSQPSWLHPCFLRAAKASIRPSKPGAFFALPTGPSEHPLELVCRIYSVSEAVTVLQKSKILLHCLRLQLCNQSFVSKPLSEGSGNTSSTCDSALLTSPCWEVSWTGSSRPCSIWHQSQACLAIWGRTKELGQTQLHQSTQVSLSTSFRTQLRLQHAIPLKQKHAAAVMSSCVVALQSSGTWPAAKTEQYGRGMLKARVQSNTPRVHARLSHNLASLFWPSLLPGKELLSTWLLAAFARQVYFGDASNNPKHAAMVSRFFALPLAKQFLWQLCEQSLASVWPQNQVAVARKVSICHVQDATSLKFWCWSNFPIHQLPLPHVKRMQSLSAAGNPLHEQFLSDFVLFVRN